MKRSYKFRLRPTAGQHRRLEGCLRSHRHLYNSALAERKQAWEAQHRSVSYYEQSGRLKFSRAEHPEMATWSFSSQQATLRRLNRAFAAFFGRVKAGEEPGYPRSKAAHRSDSVEWPKDGDGCRWKPDLGRVYLQGIGDVKVTLHRRVEGRVKTVSAKREGRRWYLVLSCDHVPAKPLGPTGRAVGVDVGTASFATTSDGEHVPNPRWARKAAEGLERAQHVLGRKKRGSANRRAARETVAARHRKVARQRRDFHHKLAKDLVPGYDVVAVEDLQVKNMARRPKPVPDPDNPGAYLPNGAAAKSGLNRSICDAGWGAFVSVLRAKAEEAGRTVIGVDPRHTSVRCEACGYAARENRANQAVFSCKHCGHTCHADEHAARNILRAGLALLAADEAA